MGRTTEDQVQTKADDNPSTVKVADLKKFYNQGHSVQETADEFNVEVDAVTQALDLGDVVDPTKDEFNVPKDKKEADTEEE